MKYQWMMKVQENIINATQRGWRDDIRGVGMLKFSLYITPW